MADKGTDKDFTDEEWENRRLCVDGNCIGVIGEDGRCKECGKLYDDSQDMADVPEDKEEDDYSDDSPEDAADDYEDASTGDDEWDSRKLCSDGNCIGVIGPDGTCKECGKPYEPES